ncbi:MAG: DNA repair protein [Clostridia bacterium]|nr:DNA repair protein [Clostridia bacterium]
MCIDLKSFYASVECVERGLDPMKVNLVVADPERSEKTICLAVSPALKALGVKNRCRIFEIPKNIEYIVAEPRMQLYIDYSAKIYGIYLKYISKDDIHVYSIDEVFIDATNYLEFYHTTARDLSKMITDEIYNTLGIRSTCGIGTNMYLAKVALDITAKHADDFIGFLSEETYKKTLWDHRPLTDFWRVGNGTANRLARYGIFTMRDIAGADEDFLYRIFGIDAELLIDHAYGIEPTTIADIKSYKAKANCLTSGQVLMRDYNFEEGRLIVKEMMDLLCLDLSDKDLVTNSITLHVGYSNKLDLKPAHGTTSLRSETNNAEVMVDAVSYLYEKIVNPKFPIRRVNITCNHVVEEQFRQFSMFDEEEHTDKNRRIQKTVVNIKKKYGRNSIVKGMNLQDAATTMDRNRQIGGHKSGEK